TRGATRRITRLSQSEASLPGGCSRTNVCSGSTSSKSSSICGTFGIRTVASGSCSYSGVRSIVIIPQPLNECGAPYLLGPAMRCATHHGALRRNAIHRRIRNSAPARAAVCDPTGGVNRKFQAAHGAAEPRRLTTASPDSSERESPPLDAEPADRDAEIPAAPGPAQRQRDFALGHDLRLD